MADKQDNTRRKQPKDTKSLTIREAYDIHKLVSADDYRIRFISGYMQGYYDATVGKPHRYEDYFDREAAIAGNDLRAADPEATTDTANPPATNPINTEVSDE